MKANLFAISLLLFLLSTNRVYAQVDSIRFENGQIIAGEIKLMDKGILKIETDYSDSDFLIEWKKVVWLKTQSYFQIAMEDGTQYYSNIVSLNDSISVIIAGNSTSLLGREKEIDSTFIVVKTKEIVFLNPYEDKFKDKFSASIDVGIDIAKAKNLKTYTTRSTIGYKADKWSADASFNTLQTTQDSTDAIKRSDGVVNFRYNLPRKWYTITTISLLSNTEQKLDMRYNAQQGFGLYMIRTNSAYWGGKLGLNRNIERYANETEDRDSWEAYVGTELDLYDIGDLSVNASVMAYLGLTERSRFRSDGNLDFKYDLPYDLYIKLGLSVNYDNKPAQDASEIDYVFQTGFGWEW